MNINISPLICLFLILLIGVSHGSLDHIKGKKLFEILKIKNISIFLSNLYFNYFFYNYFMDIFTYFFFNNFSNNRFLSFR